MPIHRGDDRLSQVTQVPRDLIQIDIDADQIGMNHPAVVGIVGDAKTALQAILAELPAKVAGDWDDLWSSRHAPQPIRSPNG